MPCTAEATLTLVRGSVTIDDDLEEHDHLEIPARMLPILPDGAQQAEILKRELEKLGWKRNEDGSVSKELEGGVKATLSPDGKSVRVETSGTDSVSVTETGEARVDEKELEAGQKQANQRAREKAERALEDAKDRARADLQAKNAARILERAPEVEKELKQAVNETVKRSLEARAGTMGTIESLLEKRDDDGSYGVEILVRT